MNNLEKNRKSFLSAPPGSLWVLDMSQQAGPYVNLIPETETGGGPPNWTNWVKVESGSIVMKLVTEKIDKFTEIEKVLVLLNKERYMVGWLFDHSTHYLIPFEP